MIRSANSLGTIKDATHAEVIKKRARPVPKPAQAPGLTYGVVIFMKHVGVKIKVRVPKKLEYP